MGFKKEYKALKKKILKDLGKNKYTEETKDNIVKFLDFIKRDRDDKGD